MRVGNRIAVGAGAVALGGHLLPLVAAVPALRRCWPRLAGLGDPDHVALTFDDGPDPRGTPEVLDALAAAGVRATFFVLGEMVERQPDLLGRIVAEGHEVGVHSWDHRSHVRHPPHVAHEQLERTVEAVQRRTGRRPTYFRPPYGFLTVGNLVAAHRLGLSPVLWTADGRDWTARATGESVATRVLRQAPGGGGTVLLHDSDCTSAEASWRATVDALPTLLARWRDLGLRVGTVDAHGLTPAA